MPDACTLPTADVPLRLADFDGLFARHVQQVRRDGATVVLALDDEPDTASQAAGLAALETRCCSFFAFDLLIAGGTTTLTLSADGHPDVLAALADRAESLAGTAQ